MKTAIQPDNKIKLPSDVVKRLRWKPGNEVYVYPLEDGLTLRSKPSKVLEAAKEFEQIMDDEKVSAEDLLKDA